MRYRGLSRYSRNFSVSQWERETYPERFAPPEMPSPPIVPDDLTLTEKCALLRLEQISRAPRFIAEEIEARGLCIKPTIETYRALVERGYAKKESGSRFHRATWEGTQVLRQIATQLQKEYRIHKAWINAGENWTASVYCTCGWSAGIRKGDFTRRNAERAFSQHLASINAVSDLASALERKAERA